MHYSPGNCSPETSSGPVKIVMYNDLWSQLFEMASRRNIQSYFWAFNIQCNIGSKLDTLQKYFSWAYFSTEMIETFWGGKEDARLARNKFWGGLETLELLEKG